MDFLFLFFKFLQKVFKIDTGKIYIDVREYGRILLVWIIQCHS